MQCTFLLFSLILPLMTKLRVLILWFLQSTDFSHVWMDIIHFGDIVTSQISKFLINFQSTYICNLLVHAWLHLDASLFNWTQESRIFNRIIALPVEKSTRSIRVVPSQVESIVPESAMSSPDLAASNRALLWPAFIPVLSVCWNTSHPKNKPHLLVLFPETLKEAWHPVSL
jgi:hypothetical protein